MAMTENATRRPSAAADSDDPFGRVPRIGILVVAYNAATTLAATLDRIPESFRSAITEVFVCDDASADGTYQVGLEYQQLATDLPVTVVHHQTNLGYGGNQKAGYRLAIEHDLDIIVLLHADGQYAPEYLPEMVAPLVRGDADAVFGSRMMVKGSARAGGMPAYKYVGNRILTTLENATLGSDLSEFHSGYRAYNVHALAELNLSRTSDGFNFDTQIIIALHDRGKRIVEIPIPTFYGDEICYVNGMQYAADVLTDVVAYRAARVGFTTGGMVQEEGVALEPSASDRRSLLALLDGMAGPPARALVVGWPGDDVVATLADGGVRLTGIGLFGGAEALDRLDQVVQANLEDGVPEGLPRDFDLVVLGGVLEQVRNGDMLLQQLGEHVAPDGRLLVSVANFSHWYPRLRATLGIFDYDQRGALASSHVRFFTRRSLLRMVRRNGFTVVRTSVEGSPLELVPDGRLRRLVGSLDQALVRLRPTLFGYRFTLEVTPRPQRFSRTYRRGSGRVDATPELRDTPRL